MTIFFGTGGFFTIHFFKGPCTMVNDIVCRVLVFGGSTHIFVVVYAHFQGDIVVVRPSTILLGVRKYWVLHDLRNTITRARVLYTFVTRAHVFVRGVHVFNKKVFYYFKFLYLQFYHDNSVLLQDRCQGQTYGHWRNWGCYGGQLRNFRFFVRVFVPLFKGFGSCRFVLPFFSGWTVRGGGVAVCLCEVLYLFKVLDGRSGGPNRTTHYMGGGTPRTTCSMGASYWVGRADNGVLPWGTIGTTSCSFGMSALYNV